MATRYLRESRITSPRNSDELPCSRIKCSAFDENETGDAVGMGRCKGERQHRTPGVTYDSWRSLSAPRTHQLKKVRHVTCDRQRLVAAAALKGLKDPEQVRKFAGHRSHVPWSTRPAVHKHDIWSGHAVFTGLYPSLIGLAVHAL